MNQPREAQGFQGPAELRLIDRLVDGELSESERQSLLRQLETTPDGWRRCALAFLEAQSWSGALSSLASTERTEMASVLNASMSEMTSVAVCHSCDSRRTAVTGWYPVARWTALAASFVIVFVLGYLLHRLPAENVMASARNQVETPAPKSPPTPAPAPAPRLAHESAPTAPKADSPLLDHLVQQWQQQGYQAERQTRLVSVQLPDGRRIAVPVEELRLQYVGDRTY